ncbi:MAG: prepilin-type N-terminal cleavage/methylation domain-containing protein [Phycisphaerales bacterium]|nr:MAG: prepilin-type N-terminal cleavage/methylation domain-containing protein [Phycisphaerales bacterium]
MNRAKAFTLAEATIAMVLLGIAAAGVLLPYASGAAVRADGVQRTLGAMLANDLIEQICVTPFDSIVATYNYSESQGQLKDSSGTTLTDSMYANFSRNVISQYVRVPQQSDTVAATFVLATVNVFYQGRTVATLNRLISE